MRLTKLGHACVRLDKDGAALVIDPGVWSQAAEALSGASAVLVTHEHDVAQFARRVIVFHDGRIRRDEPALSRPNAREILKTLPSLED